MKPTIRCVVALAIAYICMWSAQTFAQDILWTDPNGGNWTDSSNWNIFAVPDPAFDARAVIGTDVGSGAPIGEVDVTSDIRVSNPAPEVALGDGEVSGVANMGTLNITSAGALSVEKGTASDGHIDVGLNNGIGVLNVAGILEVEGELRTGTSAAGASTIRLSGSASVTAGSGFLDRNFIIDGSTVSASFTNNLILGGSGTHTWRIPAAGASKILVGGNADLGGTLKLEFPDGAPTVGSMWDLVDSATVDAFPESPASGFNNLDQSLTGVGVGERFVVNSVAGGVNGVLTQLELEQHPVLVVDRSTGATVVQNFGTGSTIGIDLYAITSNLGAMNPGGWTSLSSADPNSGWVEASPSSNSLSELNISSSQSIAGSSSLGLGNAVSIPTPTFFGQETEDIRFRYAQPGQSVFTEGTVIYTGVSNSTLTLNVDPNTGEAQVLNGTGFSVEIDVYVISSATESLDPNNGAWNSLEDQGVSGGFWFEANESAGKLSELLAAGTLQMDPNSSVSLGSPFDSVNGIQDLVFQFAVVENAEGDFDQDGDVDGSDFLQWQLGNSPIPFSASDLAAWEANYGTSGLCNCGDQLVTGKVLYSPLVSLGAVGAVEAVPEPGAVGLMLIGMSVLCGARRRPMPKLH